RCQTHFRDPLFNDLQVQIILGGTYCQTRASGHNAIILVHSEGFTMTSHRRSNEKFNKVEIIVCTRANPYRIFTDIFISRWIFAMSRGKLKSSNR
ncbi:MAG: hypothetical protein WAL42_07990, partial [Nitrososphaeraceae archaeon]